MASKILSSKKLQSLFYVKRLNNDIKIKNEFNFNMNYNNDPIYSACKNLFTNYAIRFYEL